MSKEAAMRAMREARYLERSAGSASRPGTPAVRPTGAKATERGAATSGQGVGAPPQPAPSVDALCGHRSMNGRTCTREQGHAAKSHRYG